MKVCTTYHNVADGWYLIVPEEWKDQITLRRRDSIGQRSVIFYHLEWEGEEAVIRIRDYGPGIPEEELPHVKYKFYKGSSKARGSGIGLAVCEEIVSRHNGELIISNAEDEAGGCVVEVRLPTGT